MTGVVRLAGWVGPALLVLLVGSCGLRRQQAERELSSADPAVRAQALRVLAGARATGARPQVIRLLRDRSPRVRRAAVAALGSIGFGGRRHLHAVIERLYDGDLQVRLAAVRVLGDSREAAARRALLPVLRDGSLVVRRAAAMALEALGVSRKDQRQRVAAQVTDEQLAALEDRRSTVRAEAAVALGRGGWARALPKLIAALDDRTAEVATRAAVAVGAIGGAAAASALVKLAGSPGRRGAGADGLVALLGCQRPACSTAEPHLQQARVALGAALQALGGSGQRLLWRGLTDDVRLEPGSAACAVVAPVACAGILGAPAAGPPSRGTARPAVFTAPATVVAACGARCPAQSPALLSGLRAASDPERLVAMFKVAAVVGAQGEATSRALLFSVMARYQRYRRGARPWLDRAAWAVVAGGERKTRRSGPKADRPPPRRQRRRALRWLLERFPEERRGGDDGDPLMPPAVDRGRLAEMIRSLGARRPIGEVHAWLAAVAAVEDNPLELRRTALAALAGGPAPATPPARVVTLSKAIGHREAVIRSAAFGACERVGSAAVDRALVGLADRDFGVRAAAAACLGRLGSQRGVEPLIGLLRRESQLAAIEALAALGDRRATGPIARLLQEDYSVGRYGERLVVIEALGALGDPAAAAPLERELTHPHWRVRQAAARALARAGRSTSRGELELCALDQVRAVRRACRRAGSRLARGAREGERR